MGGVENLQWIGGGSVRADRQALFSITEDKRKRQSISTDGETSKYLNIMTKKEYKSLLPHTHHLQNGCYKADATQHPALCKDVAGGGIYHMSEVLNGVDHKRPLPPLPDLPALRDF